MSDFRNLKLADKLRKRMKLAENFSDHERACIAFIDKCTYAVYCAYQHAILRGENKVSIMLPSETLSIYCDCYYRYIVSNVEITFPEIVKRLKVNLEQEGFKVRAYQNSNEKVESWEISI